MDFLRLIHGPILALISSIVILVAIFWAVLKYGNLIDAEKKSVRFTRVVVLLVVVISFGWYVIKMASVNVTPRAVIDRSVVEERKSTLEEDSHNLPPKVNAPNDNTKGDTGK